MRKWLTRPGTEEVKVRGEREKGKCEYLVCGNCNIGTMYVEVKIMLLQKDLCMVFREAGGGGEEDMEDVH